MNTDENFEIKWYSMNLDQKVAEHESIDLKGAIRIIDRYLIGAGQHFENDREAIAATLFGFSKSRTDFIEFCVLGPQQFSFKIEFSNNANSSRFRKIFRPMFQHEEELHSREELVQKTTWFFTFSTEQLVKQIAATERPYKSPLRIPMRATVGNRIFAIIFCAIIGIGSLIVDVHGIFIGRIEAGRGLIFCEKNPTAFWIWVVIYAAIGIGLIRGCVLELKFLQEMRNAHGNRK